MPKMSLFEELFGSFCSSGVGLFSASVVSALSGSVAASAPSAGSASFLAVLLSVFELDSYSLPWKSYLSSVISFLVSP